MKKIFTQSIALAVLIGIGLIANQVAAGNPAVANPGGFPNNNTPFPVTVGAYQQIKGAGAPPATGGGLAVEAFIAWQNASFDKDVGIQGILTGKPISNGSTSSNLLFGNAATSNKVTVNTTGWTYAQNGGLYTENEKATNIGTFKQLCANNAGEIILCPGGTVITPPSTGGSIRIVNDMDLPTPPFTNMVRNITPSTWTNFMNTDFPIDPQSSFASTHDAYPGGQFSLIANVGTDSRVIITNLNTGVTYCSGHNGTGNQSYVFTALDMSTIGIDDDLTILLTPGSTCN